MNLTREIKRAEVLLAGEEAKLAKIEQMIDESEHISSVLCEEGNKTYFKIRNMKADLVGMYLDQILKERPKFKGNCLYESTIKSIVGKNGFDLLHEMKTIQLCGVTEIGRLYTY